MTHKSMPLISMSGWPVLIGTMLMLGANSVVLAADAPAKPPAKTAAKPAGVKPDGTARQTAHPWDGAPTGPENSFEYAGREQVLQMDKVMDELKIGPGSLVADVGAGGGWLTMHLSERVGAKGVVFAEEILPKYTAYITDRARKAGVKNVRPRLGTATDPKLPANKLDVVVVLNAYHEFEQPLAMLRKLRIALKPGGRLGIIERDDEGLRRAAREAYEKTGQIKQRADETRDGEPYTYDHRLARDIVEREAAVAGFHFVEHMQLGADNYLVVVTR